MGWNELLDKTAYWLKLRQQRNDNPLPAPVPPGLAMPLSVNWEKIASFDRESYKVSAVMPLDGGSLVCSYNNQTRSDSRLFRCGSDGSLKELWHGKEETVGQGYKLQGTWYLPVEKSDGDILAVPADGSSCKAFTAQGGRYSCRIVEGCVAVGNQLFDVGSTSVPVATFPRLHGILCGLVRFGGEWIASDDETGIESTAGWFISCNCPDLAVVGGRPLAFLRSGEVRAIEDGKLGESIGNTRRKCRRAWSNGARCWWTTAPSDGDGKHGVWCTDGSSMLKVGEFAGKHESTSSGALGSLFGSAICEADDGTLWLALSNETEDGWVLYRGKPTFPEPVPEPEPKPDPAPAPTPTPAPKVAEVVMASKPAVWNEQSPANDYGMGGDVFARMGIVEGRTWRLLHGLYDAMPADPIAWVTQAMKDGARGIVVDVEGPFNTVAAMRTLRSACNAAGARLVGAVKVSCDPGGQYLASDFAGSIRIFEETCDAVGIWGYGCDGDGYETWMAKWRGAGFTKQIGVFQDQVRDSGGYRGKEVWKDVATHAKAGGYPFYLFLPNHSGADELAALREIFA